MIQSSFIESSIYSNEQAKRYFLEDPTYPLSFETIKYQAGETIVVEQTKCNIIRIISSGIVMQSQNKECVDLIGKDTFLGIDSLFTLSKMNVTTYTAITPTVIYQIATQNFMKKINDRKESQLFLISLMRSNTINQLHHFTALNHANTNLTRALIQLGKNLGETKGNTIYFPEGLSQIHIAEYLNISKTIMKNRLAKLIEQGIITCADNQIVLHIGNLNE
ncbi:Crp/Fnr family transcriptional regulator [Listeria booriae]|uniref:Crp/Fnr family transcriptional regulator n=1 Tax=Listeria booriae TaxID=1552123 RepID=UPI00162813C7|nr:Crp/Fnr family transcriptional regulator [Listeria booriae]MBC1651494.1 Crp/Fnr family transcriptional regulator [Listeria booriae]